ncbi:hypothetical protein HanXRQr2_Chr05g0210991 [Helianthus annuus]|uniref:Uncharacterized protein n=1 Tax=Helianthus annuus TaxID=4232 RepID=A0A251UNK7_HELAN|nr:hypothetical protein HanXRQr2_Chr05g0210991 [Helianthus annuus]KAJ0922469.1 hypothetical protein HanPSC8_Chr05g0204211 [Helianthus annuus]
MCKLVSNTVNSILGAAHRFYKWFKHLATSDLFKNPIEHIISFISINFCNLQTPKHVPIRFAQPSWIFLVFLIFHSVINRRPSKSYLYLLGGIRLRLNLSLAQVLHVLGWLSSRASTISLASLDDNKTVEQYHILF